MTEEIIIDGVNVWSCKHYDLENNYCDQSYLGEGGLLKNTKNPKRCEGSPNCYYKQLQRLKQENKLLKDKCKLLQKTVDNECALCKNDLLCKKLEKQDNYRSTLQEIKEIAEKDFNHTSWEDYAERLKQILKKIAECEVNE